MLFRSGEGDEEREMRRERERERMPLTPVRDLRYIHSQRHMGSREGESTKTKIGGHTREIHSLPLLTAAVCVGDWTGLGDQGQLRFRGSWLDTGWTLAARCAEEREIKSHKERMRRPTL